MAASGGFKALVAGLDAGAVERLLQGLAGEHAKAVGNAGLLLRLADAARHLVVDGLVVGGLAAQQAAERDDGVHACRTIGEGARRGGNLPCAGNANHFNIGSLCAAAQQGVERAIEQPLGNHRIPAGDDDGEPHAGGGEIAFDGDRLAVDRIGPGPEAEREARLRLDGEDARLPVGFRDGGEARERPASPPCARSQVAAA